MTKGLNIKDSESKVDIMCQIMFKSVSAAEIQLIKAIIPWCINNTITLNSSIATEIRNNLSITDSHFSTTIHRLQKKGMISKSGKTITLHPIFSNIQDMDKLVISFV